MNGWMVRTMRKGDCECDSLFLALNYLFGMDLFIYWLVFIFN